MKEMGQEVVVVFFRMLFPGRKIISTYFYDNIKVTQVCLPLIPIDNYFFLRINNLICQFFGWKLLKRQLITCDIIHSVYLTSNGVTAGYWAKKIKVPHIAQAIGSDVNSDMQRIAKNNAFKKWTENIDGIIANSNNLKKTIERLYPNPPEIRTIYRGIHIDSILHCNSDINGKKGVSFLFLGGLNPYKRLKYGINTKGGITLMKAWQKVEKELFQLDCALYFGGPYSNNEVLKKWKSNLNYPNQINIIGQIDPSVVKEFLSTSDVVIIPSMEEGLPNLLLESYASCKLVIGSTAGGIPEVIVDNETGFVFNKGKEDELAALLIKAAASKGKNEFMGKKAYTRAKDYFNAENYTHNVLSFYKKIVYEYRRTKSAL